MTAPSISAATLAKLAKYDTPTICNIIELFEVRPDTEGYMDCRIRAAFPEMPPMVGFAATASFRSATRPSTSTYAALEAQVELFQTLGGPAVVVFQDLDDPAVGATFGEVMCSTYKAFGSAGLITSGGGRDLLQVQALSYPVFTGSTICSHAYCQTFDVGGAVRVGGLAVSTGDLLHGDANGVTNIPLEIAAEVADAADELIAAEAHVIDYAKSDGPKSVAELKARRAAMSAGFAQLRSRLSRKRSRASRQQQSRGLVVVRIVVIDGYTLNPGDNPWTPLEKLGSLDVHDHTAPDAVVGLAKDADILITNKCQISAATIEQLPSLKFIAVSATGHNIVDSAAARRRGISVSNVPEYGTKTVAQFTWALILELCHRVSQHAESVAAGDWTKSRDFCYWLTPQIELAGKRLGLVGYGRIARQVGMIGEAFGMQVLASGRKGSSRPTSAAVEWLPVEELFASSDVISLHCPLTPETEQMVNRDLLARIRPTAFLVNTSRGGLVNERDLADALRADQLAGAAVDVVSHEPIRADNPLLSAPNCLITPHMAWTTLAARQRLMQSTVENIAAYLAGKPINVVN